MNGNNLPAPLTWGNKQVILPDLSQKKIRNPVAHGHDIVVCDEKTSSIPQVVVATLEKLKRIVKLHDSADRKNVVKLFLREDSEFTARINKYEVP